MEVIFVALFYVSFFILIVIRGINYTEKKNLYSNQSSPKHYLYHFVRLVRSIDDSEDLYFKFFKVFLYNNFGERISYIHTKMARKYLNEKRNVNIDRKIRRITTKLDHKLRLQILFFLFDLAAVDKNISIKELAYLESVNRILKITPSIFKKVKAKYIREEEKKFEYINNNIFVRRKTLLAEAFNILNIDINSDADTVKKAYRTLVKIHHPDKVATQGDEAMKKAEVKFQLITEAYEYIKVKRKIN